MQWPRPFFGRERELTMLTSLLSDCIDEPQARVVLVSGDAGMGKTRLYQEFVQRATLEHGELIVYSGRGDPLGAGSPFALLASALQKALALPEDATPTVKRERLQAYLADRLPHSMPEFLAQERRIREFLGELLAIPAAADETPSPALQAARSDPMLMGDQIRRAVLDLLSAECQERPLLFVLEDLHWGDLPTVRLLDAALRQFAERPFYLLLLGRPSVHDAFPRLFEGRGMQEIRLAGLSRKASEKIAQAVLGDRRQ